MKKYFVIAICLIVALVMAPNVFAVEPDPKPDSGVSAKGGALVWDEQSSRFGGVRGIAGGAGCAAGTRKADVVVNAYSVMGSLSASGSITYYENNDDTKPVIARGTYKDSFNYGYVGADAKATARKDGCAFAVAGGFVGQGSEVAVGNDSNGAIAMQGSHAGFLSIDCDSGKKSKAKVKGDAEVWGAAGVYKGRTVDGTEKWSGAYAENGARAKGDYTCAGGSGEVGAITSMPGAGAAGGADFCYAGNGYGYANTGTWTTSYKLDGYSYKGAHAASHAGISKYKSPAGD